MSNLVCEGVTKFYSKKKVLDNINLIIEQGKIYGLLGRNGAGKTTLLSVMTAQNICTQGRITYDKQDVWENQNALDNICFSREINISALTGNAQRRIKDYLKMASIYYPNWDKEYSQMLIDEFELDIKKRLGKLSKGMLSMVTIIVALASKSKITMLDEPTTGLDVVMREKFYNLLLEDYMQTKRTFIISTHIIEEISSIFEEVILIDRGKLILKQNTDELLESYYNITAHENIIESISNKFEVIHKESLGKKESICIKIEKNQNIDELINDSNIEISPISLQKLFVYLTNHND